MSVSRRMEQFPRSATVLYIFSTALFLGSAATFFAWFTFSPFHRPSQLPGPVPGTGCFPDSEGSWSIGVFYGGSPFDLKPIEDINVWRNESGAWPIANPVLNCALASAAGFPSNFVADPFLFIQDDIFYLFFETKNSITMQGDIGVAMSKDKGASWLHLGTALDEGWHLSYPYVFRHQDQIYMMPEGSKKGDLRLYRSLDFPLNWKLEKIINSKPLVDSFIINYTGYYWLFGSDFSLHSNGEMSIWYSSSPLGPWKPHKQNHIHNFDKEISSRNAGRPFLFNNELYRPGQESGETYGLRVKLYKVKVLTPYKYEEAEVPLGLIESKKGRNSWNGARYHHLDVQQITSKEWIAVLDGDRARSGDFLFRLMIGYAAFGVAFTLLVLSSIVLCTTTKFNFISRLCLPIYGKRNDNSLDINAKLAVLLNQLYRFASHIKRRIMPKTCVGCLVFTIIFLVIICLTYLGTHYVYGGNGAEEPYPLRGHYSQFTLLTMTYDARLWNLKMFVKHYSRCASVSGIVIVWNKGHPPELSELDSVVPIRIRVEEKNSLNNRFKGDSYIKTKAVLELDDDIMMTCDDLERGFRVWREHPERIVGYYPRLSEGYPLKYRNERYARQKDGYNIILTGAAFMDAQLAFGRYWSQEATKGREFVDEHFNCEDVLLNFLYSNATLSGKVVEYVKPSWTIDTSKFSGVAISRNTNAHYEVRSKCLVKFAKLYGNLASKRSFGSRGDGWDL
ncbi:hypothetical protein HPP92_019094 [Vanilla planifolia]|uniref:Glucosamine inositolphosphorylceramide transferase 1 n=1 Tax=Vanilla planifolia TaxID=51239 RepID=A0A835Q295_VANPL|nr:hypothetical protein HPP92_019094 [Vanilla planifolia]